MGLASYRRVRKNKSIPVKSYLCDMTPHTCKERVDVAERVGVNELPVVKPETYPKVIHKDREAGHNRDYTPWSSEFIPT